MSRPRRSSRWWGWLLVVVVVAPLVAVAGFLAMVAVSLSGGLDDLFGGDPPREGDREVTLAREEVEAGLEHAAGVLAGQVVEPVLGPGAERAGRGEVRPPCREGQHNWKIDDDFDLVCDLERIEVVTAADRDGFRAQMLALDDALRADGWSGDRWGLDLVVRDYWDTFADPTGPSDQTEPGRLTTPEPGTAPGATGRTGGYSMDDLPSARYEEQVDGRTATLVVDWVERGTSPDDVTYYPDRAELVDRRGRSADPGALVAVVPPSGYAVVLRLTVEYFRA